MTADYRAIANPETYERSRRFDDDTEQRWHGAIRRLTAGLPIARVVDLGAGTGRFTPILVDLFPDVIAMDLSWRMLDHARRAPSPAPPRPAVAGSAEAIPLRPACVDLWFLSMVYHHVDAAAAIAELDRTLRRPGYVLVRNVTRELLDHFEFLRFFPEARALDERRMPTRAAIVAGFETAGFRTVTHDTLWQRFARDGDDYVRKIGLRGLSSLQGLADEAFARGLQALAEEWPGRFTTGPIDEPMDVFVFERPTP